MFWHIDLTARINVAQQLHLAQAHNEARFLYGMSCWLQTETQACASCVSVAQNCKAQAAYGDQSQLPTYVSDRLTWLVSPSEPTNKALQRRSLQALARCIVGIANQTCSTICV